MTLTHQIQQLIDRHIFELRGHTIIAETHQNIPITLIYEIVDPQAFTTSLIHHQNQLVMNVHNPNVTELIEAFNILIENQQFQILQGLKCIDLKPCYN